MSRLNSRFFALLLAGALLGLLVSCAAPQTKVARRMDQLSVQWQTNLAHQAQLPERVLDWPSALTQLRAANLKLRQAKTEVTNAQESVHQVFRDLMPTLNLHAGANKRLVDLPNLSSSDVTFSADSFFNIPGVVSFNARLYITRLYLIRAEAAYALAEREQIIELYKAFWAAQGVLEEAHHIRNEKQTARGFETVDAFTGQMMLSQTELRELAGQHESESLQQRISELLGSHEYRWTLSTNGLPDLRYQSEPLPLTDTNRVAQLQIRLAAIELEAARAEISGIKLRYWPELTIFLTGPPLYQRSFGQEKFWDAREVRASADTFWTIDTRGYISRQLRQTRRQRDLQQERLRQDSLAMMEKLLFTQNLLRATQEKARDLEQELAVLEAIPPAQNLASLQKYASEYQLTADQLRQLRQELADLNTIFWFVDEAAWTNLSPMKPMAAAQR